MRRSWRSTLAGIASLLLIGLKVVDQPQALLEPEVQGGIAAAIGLIALKEGTDKKKGKQPEAEPEP